MKMLYAQIKMLGRIEANGVNGSTAQETEDEE
jgi:hypothetical protein